MENTAVEHLNDFIRRTHNNPDTSRDHLIDEIEAFTALVSSHAKTLSLIDFCFWRKAIEDILAHGQCRVYKRYETGAQQHDRRY